MLTRSPFRVARSIDCGGVWEYLAGVVGDTKKGLDIGVTGDATTEKITGFQLRYNFMLGKDASILQHT